MDLKTYARVLRRRKRIVVCVTLLSALAYFATLFFRPPKYQATSLIVLRAPALENQVLSYSSPFPLSAAREVDIKTQLQIMSTRAMAEAVAKEVEKARLQVSPQQVLAMRTISQVGDTPTISIVVTGKTAQEAEEVANAYARLAVAENHKLARRALKNAITYVEEKMAYNKKRLKEAETELNRFLAQEGVVSFPDELKQQMELMNSQRAQLQEADMQMEELARRITQIHGRLASVAPEAVQRRRIPNPQVESYRAMIRPLERQLLELKRSYTEAHPKVQAIQEQINELRSEMGTTVARLVEVEDMVPNPAYLRLQDELITAELDRERLRVRTELLRELHGRQRERLKSLSALDERYFELEGASESVRKQQQKLSELLEELQVSAFMQEGNAQLLETARAEATTQLKPHNIAFFIFLSLCLGVGAGVVLDTFDDRLRTPSHVHRHLRLQALGSIPRVEKNEQLVLAGQSPKAVVADPFHRLGFNLQQAAKKSDAKVIALTSTKPKEGKTTICANLAVSLSWGGSRVCLVDADLRHPGLHHLFSRSNAVGLSSLLGGELEAEGRLKAIQEGSGFEPKSFLEGVRHAVVETSEGLHLLPAGPPVPNPVRFFRSQLMRQLLQGLREDYDFIFVDTPPVLSVSDAQILAARCDGILLVVDAQTTRKNEASYVISQLKTTEKPLFGVVLNFVEPTDETYYYYYRYAGGLRR